MNELAERYLKYHDEQTAIDLVRCARCQNLHNLGCIIAEYLVSIFQHSFYIKEEYAIMLYYKQEYDKSYLMFQSMLDMRNLSQQQINLVILNQKFCIDFFKDKYINYNQELVNDIIGYTKQDKRFPLITLTITSCKRLDLFVKTINSFMQCCKDIHLIDEWFCVDDNSSIEDRLRMQALYPFINFYFKTLEEKGHPQSMNIIRKYVKTPYTFHMEDDWLFFESRNYLSECLEVLGQSSKIGQCLINKNYTEVSNDNDVKGGELKISPTGLRYYIHEYCVTDKEYQDFLERHGPGNSSSYWPHFSFRPSLLRTKIYEELGEFNETISHFEMDYSYRYINKGYISAFLEKTYCLHIGRLTSERDNKNIPNAYDLNNECQFSGKETKLSKLPFRMKTFVMNLDRRPDRMTEFNKHVKSTNFLDIERFSAIDGSKLVSTPQLQQIFENNDYNMREGMVGCAMSHINLYIQLLKDPNNDTYCIFEDDIDFVPDFQNKLLLCVNQLHNTNWDMLYLGHHLWSHHIDENVYSKTLTPKIEQFNREKSLQVSLGGTGGYMITKRGAEKLLDFINLTGMTNGIDTVQQKSADILNIFYTYPHLIYSECIKNNPETCDTDIQHNFKSLTLSLEKRLEEELKFYPIISCISTNEINSKIMNPDTNVIPYFYISDNKQEIKDIVSLCKHPCYTLEDKIVFVVPNEDNGRYFHSFKKYGVWNIDDAIQFIS